MNDGPTIRELEERIAVVRQNLAELIEQAAAFSGAGDEALAADRIARQEEELKKLVALRDAHRGK
jgi:enolase